MKCDECGRDFRPARDWQRFCSQKCRNTFHNREISHALHDAKHDAYRAEVAAHEARINGYTQIDLVANEPPKLEGPKLVRRPIRSSSDEQTA